MKLLDFMDYFIVAMAVLLMGLSIIGFILFKEFVFIKYLVLIISIAMGYAIAKIISENDRV